MLNLYLKKNMLSRYDPVASFPLGDLKISINGIPRYSNAEYRFIATLNDLDCVKASITELNNIVKIPQSKIDSGIFKAVIAIYLYGKKIEEYEAEPLIITNVNGQYFADPYINTIMAELGETKDNLDKYIKQVDKANAEKFEQIYKALNALTTFAYACIKAIPYISNYKFTEETNND